MSPRSLLLLLLLFPLCGRGAAPPAEDALASIQRRGALIWGADEEGGGPYVYPQAKDPTKIEGFEVEIAALLAQKLGVRPQFAQGQWEKLPEVLERGDIDIVLNGYEWSPSRAARYGTSVPYYIYELQLLARKEDSTLTTWDDLTRPAGGRPRRVAVLGGSAAQDYLREHFGGQIEIVSFDGATDAMRAVELGTDGVDANLQDLPVAVFYGKGFPGLRPVGEAVGRGDYVILTRKGETRLLKALDEAIVAGLRDGTLRRLYERYGMWNRTQAARGLETDGGGNFVGDRLPANPKAPGSAPQAFVPERGWRVVMARGGLLLTAAWMTIRLSVLAMPLAILIGLISALLRLHGPRLLQRGVTLYVELVRGTPLVLQLYVIFFLLPELGLSLPAFWAAVIGLAINYSAYEAEIYRAGLEAVPRGQMEAALALGMTRGLALRRIIVPQATRIVIPPVTNDFIALFKDTAVCSVITVIELSKAYYIHARSTGAILELGLVTALLYLAMSYPLSLLARHLERRLAHDRRSL